MAKTIEEATEALKNALPYLRYAVEQAREDGGIAKLAVASENPDGSGKLIAKFECDEFFEDIATVIGLGPQTEEQTNDAKAVELLQRIGVK